MPTAFKSKGNLIGRRIRQRRIEIGLSQEGLGERLGVSYQQIQKYEKGVSRLTVDRLQEVARCLHISIDYFLKDLPTVREPAPPYDTLSVEEKRLLKQFRAISNPSVRLALLRLIQAMGRRNEEKSLR
ncbi:MAG: helix-turn-helix domain-containing protein [Nitrospiria bacterium]